MNRTAKKRGERGIALIIALFALLLLSAVGLAMMYSSNMETSINTNFRDKQAAAYASMSGALEARDRLQPAVGDIAAPAGIPSTSAANVIYIINPQSGETVAPWDYSNQYADTELCQENTLGLTGTAGVPCTGSSALPSGSSWYSTIDDSSSGSYGTLYTAYKQSTPLTYKWTRITLKTDNMTPVGATVSSTTGNQVCWDGKNQVVQPSGASPTCIPTGQVTGVTLTSAGTGYHSAPSVTFSGGGGSGAAAVVTTSNGPSDQVMEGTVTNGGSNYTTVPTVTLSGGGGLGATAEAVIVPLGKPVQSVTGLSSPSASSACYSTPPSVSFTGGGGSVAAAATAVLESTPSCIYSISTTSNSGNCNLKNTTVTFGAGNGGGSGFQGTLTFDNSKKISGWSVTAPGTGYTSVPTSLSGISCQTNPTITFGLGYHVASINLTSGGGGYTAAPTVVIAAPATNVGTVPTATANLGSQPANAGQVTGITILTGGSGYTSAPTVSFSGGGGTGAAGVVSLGTKTLTGITLTSGGSGYTYAPTVTLTGGGGSGAGAVAAVSSGTYYGQVFLITSYAQTPSGSKAITQMEVASPVRSFAPVAALTLDGPSPNYQATTSNNFFISGTDGNTCSETSTSTKPAIGTFDDPNNPTSPSAQSNVITAVSTGGAKPQNYTGSKPAPDVENVYSTLGNDMTTPAGMEALANAIAGMSGANIYPPGSTFPSYPIAATSSINLGTAAVPQTTIVNGDLSLSGSQGGYGILLVRGNLTMSGNFSWHGPIFVIGQGSFTAANGAGNGQIVGSLFIAKTRDGSNNMLTSLGQPYVNFNGGGNNYIQYDHCWADKYYAKIPYLPPPPTTPLKILSTRTVTY